MYCPSCRSEYREGIMECAHCRVPLVVELAAPRTLAEDDPTVAVGMGDGVLSVREFDGIAVDLARVFALDRAKELQALVEAAGVPTILRERHELKFPDGKPRFELHVHAEDQASAEAALKAAWRAQGGLDVSPNATQSLDACPACGAPVELTAEECPDCGLFVGRAEDA